VRRATRLSRIRGRLDADVLTPLVGQLAGQVEHRLHRERSGRDERDLRRHGGVFADRLAPLHSLRRPLPRVIQDLLARGDKHRGKRQASGVQRRERDSQPVAFLADQVLGGNADLVQVGHTVLDAAQSHELVAVLDGDAGGVRLDDECRDAAPVPVALGNARHDHEQFGDDAVGRPELRAVEHVRAVLGRVGGRAQAGRVRTDVGFGEQERAHRPARTPRQVALLLLRRSGQLERLGDADRLVCRQERAHARVQ
jgi:hypothetical protein